MIEIIYFSVFSVGVFMYFRVKYLVRKYYKEKHAEIYGESLLDHSVKDSIKVIYFSLSKSEWDFVKNDKLMFWLKAYRLISIIFYLFVFCGLIYLIAYIAIEFLKI